jgi:hypothetical protein
LYTITVMKTENGSIKASSSTAAKLQKVTVTAVTASGGGGVPIAAISTMQISPLGI